MAQRNEHLVVITLQPFEHGQEFEIWPPKITIVPWFPCDDFVRLDKTLAGVVARHKKFSAQVGKRETWGKKEPFDVSLIEDEGELQNLHNDVFESLEASGFPIHQKDYLGDKYRPHVTLRNRLHVGWGYASGHKILIDKFELVSQRRLKGSGRMIKKIRKEYALL